MLELTGVRHTAGGRAVLDVPSLRVEAGARLAVVGPNGSGKSTLLRLMAFLEPPTRGTVALEGRAVRSAAERRAARRRVTLVEQRPFLFHGTVADNVAWGLGARHAPPGATSAAVAEALALLQLAPLAAREARAISEGEGQRVALARALATGADVLLLDEPVSGADRAAAAALFAAVEDVRRRRNVTVCVASHQLEDAYRWADRVLALHDGTPVPVTPENLFRVELAGGAGLMRASVGRVVIEVATDRTGPVTLAIPPEEILLSKEPLRSSARNAVAGRIIRVAEQGQAVRVTVDAGVELVALVTRRSFEDLGLAVGGPVVASFKSVAVRVF